MLRPAPVLALAVFGASWAAVLFRLADAPPVTVAFWRLALSLLLPTIPALLLTGGWRQLRASGRAEWAWMVVAGACLALHFITWFSSLGYTSVASSTVLLATHPLWVGVLSALILREAPGRLEWVGIAAAVVGAAIVGWGDLRAGSDSLLGDGLALLAALMLGVYVIAGRRVRPRLGLWSYVTVVYAVAAALTGMIAVASGVPLTGYPASTWWVFAALAAGPMLLGHTGFNWALRYVRAYVVSVLQLLEPIGATVIAVLILGRGEVPTANTVVGGAVILLGVWIALRATGDNFGSRRQRARPDGSEP